MQDNDLISRAAAIDAIVSVTAFPDAEYIKNLCQNPANSEDWLGGVCDAINAVEDVNAVDGWISVKDRLPELTRQVESDDFLIDYSEYVVVLSEGRNHFPKIGRYAREGLRERWEDKDYDPIPDVTHWMPLPST